jgi:7-cyano-7-deazaguanine synthase
VGKEKDRGRRKMPGRAAGIAEAIDQTERSSAMKLTFGLRYGKAKVSSRKCVVLLSGGIDSSTLLYYLKDLGYDCYPLTILYGQRHFKEQLSAQWIAQSLDLLKVYTIVDLTALGALLPSALTKVGEIPEGHYTDAVMSQTVVPNRNMILLSVAAGYAKGLDASYVAYAAHAGDHPIYPDCRPDFIKSVGETIRLGTGGSVELIEPFQKFSKAGIVELGHKLEVPFELTWSCYQGREVQCGKCGTCVEVRLAFIETGITNPIVYESPLDKKYFNEPGFSIYPIR